MLSPHFTLDELTRSQVAARRGLDNRPGPVQTANLRRLCATLLEPVRAMLGTPLQVDSGYRSQAVNAAVGGVDTSQHLDGCAADVVPVGLPLREAFERIRLSALPYDQLILECGSWIHLSVARREDQVPRRQALAATGGPGAWRYQEVSRG